MEHNFLASDFVAASDKVKSCVTESTTVKCTNDSEVTASESDCARRDTLCPCKLSRATSTEQRRCGVSMKFQGGRFRKIPKERVIVRSCEMTVGCVEFTFQGGPQENFGNSTWKRDRFRSRHTNGQGSVRSLFFTFFRARRNFFAASSEKKFTEGGRSMVEKSDVIFIVTFCKRDRWVGS